MQLDRCWPAPAPASSCRCPGSPRAAGGRRRPGRSASAGPGGRLPRTAWLDVVEDIASKATRYSLDVRRDVEHRRSRSGDAGDDRLLTRATWGDARARAWSISLLRATRPGGAVRLWTRKRSASRPHSRSGTGGTPVGGRSSAGSCAASRPVGRWTSAPGRVATARCSPTSAGRSPRSRRLSAAAGSPRSRGLRVVRGDARSLPFPDESFDLVMSTDMWEHIEEDDQVAARGVPGAAVPGGRLLVAVPAGMDLWSGHDVALGHVRRYERAELVALVRGRRVRGARTRWAGTCCSGRSRALRAVRNTSESEMARDQPGAQLATAHGGAGRVDAAGAAHPRDQPGAARLPPGPVDLRLQQLARPRAQVRSHDVVVRQAGGAGAPSRSWRA